MGTLISNSDALTHFTAVFSKVDLATDIALQFSCNEVEALAGLLRALGDADTWIREHATGDETGDAHYVGDQLEYAVPTDPMDDPQCDSCQ